MAQAYEKGVLAVFEQPSDFLKAMEKMRGLSVEKMQCFSPFPVHGFEKAMGLKRSWIPYATIVYALSGAAALFGFQSWTSAFDWPINVGGKPMVSWPAFIPITFEGAILFGGVLTVLTLFFAMRLPNYKAPVLDNRFTNDRFGIFICETDPSFQPQVLEAALRECHASEVKRI